MVVYALSGVSVVCPPGAGIVLPTPGVGEPIIARLEASFTTYIQ